MSFCWSATRGRVDERYRYDDLPKVLVLLSPLDSFVTSPCRNRQVSEGLRSPHILLNDRTTKRIELRSVGRGLLNDRQGHSSRTAINHVERSILARQPSARAPPHEAQTECRRCVPNLLIVSAPRWNGARTAPDAEHLGVPPGALRAISTRHNLSVWAVRTSPAWTCPGFIPRSASAATTDHPASWPGGLLPVFNGIVRQTVGAIRFQPGRRLRLRPRRPPLRPPPLRPLPAPARPPAGSRAPAAPRERSGS